MAQVTETVTWTVRVARAGLLVTGSGYGTTHRARRREDRCPSTALPPLPGALGDSHKVPAGRGTRPRMLPARPCADGKKTQTAIALFTVVFNAFPKGGRKNRHLSGLVSLCYLWLFARPPINLTGELSRGPSLTVPVGQGLVMSEARASLTPGTGDQSEAQRC